MEPRIWLIAGPTASGKSTLVRALTGIASITDDPETKQALTLATVANLSQFHLARYFRLAFGRPPIAYHRALRLARAAEYLTHGEGTIAEAAEIAGAKGTVAEKV